MIQAYVLNIILFTTVLYIGVESVHDQDDDVVPFEDQSAREKHAQVATQVRPDINCENFSDYALNCTMNAAVMYNSYRKSPPMPAKIYDWCRAVKYLTNCALEWNVDCRDVTDSHFNEESINGHSYVVHNVCDDREFLDKYMLVTSCVEHTADQWEVCYTNFKSLVDGFKKNTSADWTHYETHFHLCCGRAKFRRCVLDTVFYAPDKCTHSQAITLQKFSVIVSEGDVYQDCDFNMIYKQCPGGDPRPPHNSLNLGQVEELGKEEPFVLFHGSGSMVHHTLFYTLFCFILLIFYYVF